MPLMASAILRPGPSPARRLLLVRRVRLLVAATIGYNLVEAAVALTAGTLASSTALVGFGLDSLIEVSSAAAVAWQFSGRDPERRERAALRAIAVSFFALAAYVSIESVRALAGAERADSSTVGIALAAVSLLVMPVLSVIQRRAGRELGSASAVADSKQTLLCTYLSAVLLVGLAANALLGWWWADPVAALLIGLVAAREGLQAWRGDSCCAPGGALHATGSAGQEAGCTDGSCADGCCADGSCAAGGHAGDVAADPCRGG
jgi:divalent metal cation (Fe/Co/Zn/Cd) transporter